MNTRELRKSAQAVYLATDAIVSKDIFEKLIMAANEIDRLRTELSVCESILEKERMGKNIIM